MSGGETQLNSGEKGREEEVKSVTEASHASSGERHRHHMPDAVLLSQFTTAYPALLVAVNLGGLSLITLNTYRKLMPGGTRGYLIKYLIINFLFLALLIGVGYLNVLVLA